MNGIIRHAEVVSSTKALENTLFDIGNYITPSGCPVICEIDDARMFLHVIKERRDPLSVLREAISNAYDANATQVNIIINVLDHHKIDIGIQDNGSGLKPNDFRYFFGLGFRNKTDPCYIGNKGLGTKLFFNAERLTVTTRLSSGNLFEATIENPIKELEAGRVPQYSFSEGRENNLPFPTGTSVRIVGFQANTQSMTLSWQNLVNYIKWYTAVGSCRPLFNRPGRELCVDLTRRGRDERQILIPHGHELPGAVNPCIDSYDHYCRPFDSFQIALVSDDGKSLGTMDMLGSIVGPGGHLVTDRRIKKQYKGVFLAKDYIVIRSVNDELFSGTGEWQNMHVIANCDELSLAMGRDDFIETGPCTVYSEALSALREFVNAVRRGERFRYRGQTTEVGDNFAGACYSQLKALGEEKTDEEMKNLRDVDLVAITSSMTTHLTNKGGPVFAPMDPVGVLLLFQALISNNHLFRLHGNGEKMVGYRMLGHKSDCVIVQKCSTGIWGKPLFYSYTLNGKVGNLPKGFDGQLCWSLYDDAVEETANGGDLLILKDNVTLSPG